MAGDTLMPRSVGAIDWSAWFPRDHATLVFVVRDGRVLLIRKKRGLGAGKINGPGGRLEAGESPAVCAVRETEEELGIRVTGLASLGEISFQFANGYSTHVHVFRADGYEGEPVETDEAIPIWVSLEEIPYEEMWADDRLWLPHLLAGRRFSGRFLFDDDMMVDHVVETHT